MLPLLGEEEQGSLQQQLFDSSDTTLELCTGPGEVSRSRGEGISGLLEVLHFNQTRKIVGCLFPNTQTGNTTYPLGDSLWSIRKFPPQMAPVVKIERMVKNGFNLNIGAPDGNLVFISKKRRCQRQI